MQEQNRINASEKLRVLEEMISRYVGDFKSDQESIKESINEYIHENSDVTEEVMSCPFNI